MTKIILLLLAAILSACGSMPAPRLPQAVEQAQTADKDARRALRSGDLLRARHDFAKALLLQQSLDDTAAAATTIINLATVTHQLHDDEAALVWLDKILLEKTALYPADSNLAAAFRKTVILTSLARLPEADAALRQAEKLCDKKCPLRFNIEALHARLQLLKGDAQGALVLAQAISKEADAGQEEQANALRIIAAAEEKLARYTDSLQHYQAALEMDKTLGLGARIVEDLSGMARTAKQLGRDQEASAFARRSELATESLRQTIIPLQ
jgi:tetratricopeptide (TPR) repeat protein